MKYGGAGRADGAVEAKRGPIIRPLALAPPDVSHSPGGDGSTPSGFSGPITYQGSGGSGGSPPVLKVRFTGPGLHTYDPPGTPMPNVVQGSAYNSSGGNAITLIDSNTGTRLDGPSAAWQLESYTWTFPTGALKGYGKFNNATERGSDPSGFYTTFAGDPDPENVATTYARVEGFTADDLEKAPPIEANDHVIDTFYWGPTVTGTQTVSVNATFRNTSTLQTFTDSDSVQLNIVRPTGNITLTAPFGTAGTSTTRADGFQWLQLDVNSKRPLVSPTSVGIAWSAYVNPSAGPISSIGGTFAVTQTMDYFSQRRYTGWPSGTIYTETDGLLPGKVSPGTILDSLHYINNTTQVVGTNPSTGSPNTIASDDSPGTPLTMRPTTFTTPLDYSRADNFVSTLMYQPGGGIWIPVGKIEWGWSGVSTWTGTAYAATVSAQTAPTGYAPTTTFPVWITSFPLVRGTWQQTSP